MSTFADKSSSFVVESDSARRAKQIRALGDNGEIRPQLSPKKLLCLANTVLDVRRGKGYAMIMLQINAIPDV